MYGIGLEKRLPQREAPQLPGHHNIGPVSIGNQAHERLEHDVYSNLVLAAAQALFDRRLLRPSGIAEFERLEAVGEQAYRVYATPDAGLWQLRTWARVHTSSALMCFAACDQLSKIALHLGRAERALQWRQRALEIREAIHTQA